VWGVWSVFLSFSLLTWGSGQTGFLIFAALFPQNSPITQ